MINVTAGYGRFSNSTGFLGISIYYLLHVCKLQIHQTFKNCVLRQKCIGVSFLQKCHMSFQTYSKYLNLGHSVKNVGREESSFCLTQILMQYKTISNLLVLFT